MTANEVQILDTEETLFFSRVEGKLRQWVRVRASYQSSGSNSRLQAQVSITAADEEVITALDLLPGVHAYRCYAPTLWPEKPPERSAPLLLKAGNQVLESSVSVGTHRPWVVYLLADVCTDATWVYADFDAMRKDDADLTAAELALAEATRKASEANSNHYNLVHALNLEYFAEFYPERVANLVEAMQRGEITLNPFFNMTLTQNISLEEQIRLFYPARQWAVKHGLEMYANHQETPSIAWDMVTVLAGCGLRHLVKAMLPYECAWASRLVEPPLFAWEGQDGSRILVRRRNSDYVEGNFVLKGLAETMAALHGKILPEYERLGERYPFNAIALLGCYGDLIPYQPMKPQSRDLPLLKAATIARYNDQGWEYPKLVNASHKQFWDDVESQIAKRDIQLETYHGDYGTGWDAWPACLASDAAAWRRGQERAATADKLASILSRLAPGWIADFSDLLQDGWRNLRLLADHAWNGANDANRELNATLRRRWQIAANRAFDQVIAGGLQALSRRVPSGKDPRILVFNGLPWDRSGLVRIVGHPIEGEMVDLGSGVPVSTQEGEEEGQTVLYLLAQDVPGVGYRVYESRPKGRPLAPEQETWKVTENRLEGPFYAVEVSPVTGGLVSLYDKVRDQELVDSSSPYHLNQAVCFSGSTVEQRPYKLFQLPVVSNGIEQTPKEAKVQPGLSGPVFSQLVIYSEMKDTRITSKITLYAHLDRVDICNEVEKMPTRERQELDFIFPFNVPGREYRYETPGAIVTPGKDHLPGAGQAYAVVRHFVDVFNAQYGVTLSQADSFIVEFGHRTTMEDPLEPDPNNSTVLAVAMGNIFDANEAIRDQGGISHFVFRYSLQGHAGGFDPLRAIHFGWEDNNELMGELLQPGQAGELPPDVHSFVHVTPDNVILTGLKPAEEEGLIARFWECSGQACQVQLELFGLGATKSALRTDLLERDQSSLPVKADGVALPIPAHGLAALRIILGDSPGG